MDEKTGFSQVARLSPAIDLGLLLLIAVFGAAGLQRLVGAQSSATASASGGGPSSVSPPDAERLQQSIDRLERELGAARRRGAELREHVSAQAAHRSEVRGRESESQKLALEFRKLEAELTRQREIVRQLEEQKKRCDSQRRLIKQLTCDVKSLDADLKTAQIGNDRISAQNEALDREIRQARNKTLHVQCTPLARMPVRQWPVYLVLSNGTVAPLEAPYYRRDFEVVDRGQGTFESQIKATRQQSGAPLERAGRQGSELMNLLAEVRSDQEYVALLVDGSSFAAFRALREILRERSLPFGWEPREDSAVVCLTADGQGVLIDQ